MTGVHGRGRGFATVAFGDKRDLDAARAARSWVSGPYGEVHYRSIADSISAVARGKADCAFLPVEDSLGAAGTGLLDQFGDAQGAQVVGEVETEMTASLLALPDVGMAGLRSVVGRQGLLAVACDALAKLPVDVRATRDVTAEAAKLVQRQDRTVGVLAPAELAQRLRLEVLREDMSSGGGHWVRHWVVGRSASSPTGTRTAAVVGPVFGARTLKTLRSELQSRGVSRFRVADRRGGEGDQFLVEFDHAVGAGEELLRASAPFCKLRLLGTWCPRTPALLAA